MRDSGWLLERSEELSSLGVSLAEVVGTRRGRLVLVSGEAGVGKTALARRFCDGQGGSVRLLWGNCEALFTPSPLGPLFDIAELTGGELEELVACGAKAHEVVAALARELDIGDTPADSAQTVAPAPRSGDTPADHPSASRPPQFETPARIQVVRPERAIVRDGNDALPVVLSSAALLVALGGSASLLVGSLRRSRSA